MIVCSSSSVPDAFAGIVVGVYERHAILADKFLGQVRLKFNTERLENGDDEVDAWFTLSALKGKSAVTGEIHLKVIYGDGSKRKKPRVASVSKGNLPAVKKDDDSVESESDKAPDEKPSLAKSGNWQKKDKDLAKSTFVVITEDKDKHGKHGAITHPAKSPRQENVEVEEPKETTTPSVSLLTTSTQKLDQHARDARYQLEQVQKAVKETPNGCILEVVVDDLTNAVLIMINRTTGKTSKVTLMIPQNLTRGEYTLWTRDGAYELGRAGSVLRAINKIVESFARKNSVKAEPSFPEAKEEKEKGRGMLLASGWANLDRADSVSSSDSDDEEKPADKGKGKGKEKHKDGELTGDDDQNDAEMEEKLRAEDLTGGRQTFFKHVEEFKLLHGPSEIGVLTTNQMDYTLRLALTPKNFLDMLMAEIWQIKYQQRMIIEMDVVSPYYMESTKPPPVRTYQTDARDIGQAAIAVASFGLQWFLQKRLEIFLGKNWPPKHTHLFLDMMSYAIDKVMTCTDNCIICDKRLAFSMLKPSICEDSLCLFSHEQFGLGVDPAAEIAAHPEVVDMLISSTMAAALGGDGKRFTPFPNHLEVKWKDAQGKEVSRRFQSSPTGDPTATDLQNVRQIIEKFPSVSEMARWPTTQELKAELDKRDHMAYPLLRWILTSNRAHLAKLKTNEHISSMSTKHQYLLLSSPPAKERKFQEEKKKHGSFWAFHGSAFNNWHSILRNGLKNLSGTALMSTGAVYGNGIYLAADSNTSIGYARGGSGWEKSIFNEGGNSNMQLLALCEVVNANYKANPYYVIPNEDHVITRYLFLFNNRNTHRNVLATSITIPQLEYLKYNKSY